MRFRDSRASIGASALDQRDLQLVWTRVGVIAPQAIAAWRRRPIRCSRGCRRSSWVRRRSDVARTQLPHRVLRVVLPAALRTADVGGRTQLHPFSQHTSDALLNRFFGVTEATLLGTALVAVAQGTLVGTGFWLVDLPNPLFWGTVTAFASVLPVLGSGLVWAPASIMLLAQGRVGAATTMLVIGAAIASNVDNLIRPLVYKRVSKHSSDGHARRCLRGRAVLRSARHSPRAVGDRVSVRAAASLPSRVRFGERRGCGAASSGSGSANGYVSGGRARLTTARRAGGGRHLTQARPLEARPTAFVTKRPSARALLSAPLRWRRPPNT